MNWLENLRSSFPDDTVDEFAGLNTEELNVNETRRVQNVFRATDYSGGWLPFSGGLKARD